MSSIRPHQSEKSSISTSSSLTLARQNEPAEPDQKLTKWQSFKRSIWNPNKKTFLTRTAKSWLFLLLFYPIFIGVIFGVFFSIIWAFRSIEERYYDIPVRNKTLIFWSNHI